MDRKSLDEFFAQAEDVLTNWRGSGDAANTADPGLYDLEAEEVYPWCQQCIGWSWCLGSVLFDGDRVVVTGPPDFQIIDHLTVVWNEDGSAEITNSEILSFTVPEDLVIPPEVIGLSQNNAGDENIANDS